MPSVRTTLSHRGAKPFKRRIYYIYHVLYAYTYFFRLKVSCVSVGNCLKFLFLSALNGGKELSNKNKKLMRR